MTAILKYRLSALVLALLFCVFNVGLPIVLDSCPMAQSERGSLCTLCHETTGFEGITSIKNRSCCNTVIAAERNTQEFVKAKNVLDKADRSSLFISSLQFILPPSGLHSTICNSLSSSPPVFQDIITITSSLLI